MNNKTQKIIDFIKEGKTYKQIQEEIRVSPSRISAVKQLIKRREILKKSLSASIDDENGSESSDFGSKSSENRPLTVEQCRLAELNGSEIAEIVAFQREVLEIRKERWLLNSENEKKRLENEAVHNKNEAERNKNEAANIKLRKEELVFKENEAERPLKILFSRLMHLIKGEYLNNITVEEVRFQLENASRLKTDYLAQAFADNLSFNNSPHAKAIEEVLELLRKIQRDLDTTLQKVQWPTYRIEFIMIKNSMLGIDHRVG